MDLSRESQTSTNTSEFEHQFEEVRNDTKSESLSKVQGRESLIFQIYVTFSIDFPIIYITIICSPMLLTHFSCYFGNEGDFLLPAHTRFSPSFGYCF